MASELPSRPRVLLVDDDPRLVHIVTLYLQVQDLEVLTAGDGQEALALMQHGLPDLVITDVMMPTMDGLTLCRRIREMPGGEHLPIIVFTALDAESDQRAARDAGANQMITKPFNLTGLGDAVSDLISGPSAA